MDHVLILSIILVILLISQLIETALDWLNLKAHHRELPAALADHMSASEYARGYDYHHRNYRFGLLQSLVSAAILLSVLAFGGLGWLDQQLRTVTDADVPLGLLFFLVLFLANECISLPFGWYHTFVIEEEFGFNKTTPRTFWLDKVKGYALTMVVGGAILALLIWLVETIGPSFWIWFWLFMSVFSVVMSLFYTSWILPLFNRLSPLGEGSLRQAIDGYARRVGFPLSHISVIDGSRRSSKANAFFTGLGKKKKVVLYDTLIEQHTEEELVAVLAHEVGHYKRGHIYQGLAIGLLQSGLTLFLSSLLLFSPSLSQALGGEVWAIHLNLIAFGLLYSPLSTLLGIGMNLLSRKNEYEADRFAAETYGAYPLQTALMRLHAKNLSHATPHPWYVFVNYSHPPLLARLRALASLQGKTTTA